MNSKQKPAVGYIRMSTDQQQDSPERQRRDIEAMAVQSNFKIIKWYEDHGQTGTESSKRKEFQKLLVDAKTGTFSAVLLSEQSRMSREDIFDCMQLLRNPVYAGTLRIGHYARGKFSRVAEDGIIEIENAHEAIISSKLFSRVQGILDDRKSKRSYRPATRYLLSGLIRCSHCGQRMHGVRKIRRSAEERYYQCGAVPGVHGYVAGCPRPVIHVDKLDRFVIQAIREKLRGREAEKKIRESIIRAKQGEAGKFTREEKRLAQLRSKIERGTENLALADKANFMAISKLLDHWREEKLVLADSLEKNGRDLEPLPEALRILSRLADVSKNLDLADRAKLKIAIHQTVRSISISVHPASTGEIEYRAYSGEVRFHEAFGIPSIAIPAEVIGTRRIWRELGELVRNSNKPLHLADFADHIRTKDLSHAAYHVRRSELAGLIKKVGHQGGWISV